MAETLSQEHGVILGLVPRICFPLKSGCESHQTAIDPLDKPEDDGAVVEVLHG